MHVGERPGVVVWYTFMYCHVILRREFVYKTFHCSLNFRQRVEKSKPHLQNHKLHIGPHQVRNRRRVQDSSPNVGGALKVDFHTNNGGHGWHQHSLRRRGSWGQCGFWWAGKGLGTCLVPAVVSQRFGGRCSFWRWWSLDCWGEYW